MPPAAVNIFSHVAHSKIIFKKNHDPEIASNLRFQFWVSVLRASIFYV